MSFADCASRTYQLRVSFSRVLRKRTAAALQRENVRRRYGNSRRVLQVSSRMSVKLTDNFSGLQLFSFPRYIEKIFTQLEEFRAFELLRSGLDRSKYLLVKEVKIIAMTCTHAALKRTELVELGE